MGPIKSVMSVCASVRPCVMHYLRNRSKDFSETWYEVGGKKIKKCSTDAFLRFLPVFSKTAHLCEKNTFLAIFASFWDFAENPFRGFFLNFAKMCQKIILKDRTVVSPGKIRYFRDFGWICIPKLTSMTQNFHFAITFGISVKIGSPPYFSSAFLHFLNKLYVLEFLSMWRQNVTSALTSKTYLIFFFLNI